MTPTAARADPVSPRHGPRYRVVVAALKDTVVPVARAVMMSSDDAVLGTPFAMVEYVSDLYPPAEISTAHIRRDRAHGLDSSGARRRSLKPDHR